MANTSEWKRFQRQVKKYFSEDRQWVTNLVKVLCMVLAAFVFVGTLRPVNKQTNYGIDVSSHNGKIDWSDVRQDGVSFAIIRAGGRSYGGNARIYEDTQFRKNLKHAHRNGLRVGVYFYSQAVSEDEARAEAQFCVDQLKGVKLELPIYIDFEDTQTGGKGRADGLTVEQRTNAINAFAEVVEKEGYKAGLYSNRWYLNNKIKVSDLKEDISIWVAEYSTTKKAPSYTGTWELWQYSDKGKVKGIDGSVDLNRFYVKS